MSLRLPCNRWLVGAAATVPACGPEVELQGECSVVINEILTDNLCAGVPLDEDGLPVDTGTEHPSVCPGERPAPDWVELYNSGRSVDLCGWKLQSDSYAFSWQLCDPKQTYVGCDGAEVDRDPPMKIPSQGYLVIVADNHAAYGPRHASFDLPNWGGVGRGLLQLFDANRRLCSEVTYPDLHYDQAFARMPDGTGDFVKTDRATRGMPNVSEEE